MAYKRKVAKEQVLAAIRAWHGNVTGAAAELGMARNNLRDALNRYGVGKAELDAMRAPAGARAETRPGPRVRPDHLEAYRQAKCDLQAVLRVELDESEVHAMFHREAFQRRSYRACREHARAARSLER